MAFQPYSIALYYGHQDIAHAIAAKKGGLDIFEASVLGKVEQVKNLIGQDRALVVTYSPDGFTL